MTAPPPSDSPIYQLAPVILDLDGNGVDLVSIAGSTIMFDMDGDGILDRTGWVGPNDGLLVYDANGNGIVDNGGEISFTSYVAGAQSDLEGLAFFDSNGNGQLDAGDRAFANFSVWQDANQNGVTDAGELRGLDEAGVVLIDLSGTRTGIDASGTDNVLFATSSFIRKDASSGTAGDVVLAFEKGGSAETSITDTASSALAAATTIVRHNFDRKSRKYRIQSQGGNLFVARNKPGELADPRAGQVGPASILTFTNRSVGYLTAIVIDLDDNGLSLRSSRKSQASFDSDGDGVGDDTGWLSATDGILVIDRNGDGKIGSASELSFLTEQTSLTNSFQGLALLDSNRDGRIDGSDARFGELRIWVDSNGDGQTGSAELRTLAELGIAEISLSSRANDTTVKVGKNIVLSTATFRRNDGTTGSVGDAALAFTPSSRPGTPQTSSGAVPPAELTEAQLQSIRDALSAEGFGNTQSPANAAMALANDPDATRIARMIQAMAMFGITQGAAETSLTAPETANSFALHAAT